MQKDESYHEAAIAYNEGLAEFAEKLAPTLGHPEVERWCKAVGKQHRFHAKRHQAALDKILSKKGSEEVTVESIPDGLDVPEVVEKPAETSVKTFDDGCVESHKPLDNPDCEFSPNKVVNFSG